MVLKRRRRVRRHRGSGLYVQKGRGLRHHRRRRRVHRGEGILSDALKFVGLDFLL